MGFWFCSQLNVKTCLLSKLPSQHTNHVAGLHKEQINEKQAEVIWAELL